MASMDSFWQTLPAWAGPERLFTLMNRCRAGRLTRVQDNEFTEQLLRVVWMQFAQHRLADKLRQVRADPERVAQDAAMHLRRKSAKGFKLKARGWRPMMTAMNTATYRFVLTELMRATKQHQREAVASDYFSARTSVPGDAEGEESGMDSSTGAGECRSPDDIRESLEAAKDHLIGDIVCSEKQWKRLELLFDLVCEQVFSEQTPLPYSALPRKLKEVSRELHALITARILRFIRHLAAS